MGEKQTPAWCGMDQAKGNEGMGIGFRGGYGYNYEEGAVVGKCVKVVR